MPRFLWTVRWICEGAAGFWILLIVPFLGIDLLHSQAPIGYALLGFLVLCIMFLIGLLLFRDAVRIRLRLKAES